MSRRPAFFIVGPVALVAALASGISAFLDYGKFDDIIATLEQYRYTGAALRVQGKIEAALDLGVPLGGIVTMSAIVGHEREILPEILAVVVYSADGTVLYAAGTPPRKDQVPAAWLGPAPWKAAGPGWHAAGVPLADGVSEFIGGVAVLYRSVAADHMRARMAWTLGIAAAVTAGATAAFGVLGVLVLQRADRRPGAPDALRRCRRLRAVRPVVAYLLGVVLLAQIGLATYASTVVLPALAPELRRDVEAVARSLAATIDRVLAVGVPFDHIEGAEAYFARTCDRYPSVAFVALVGRDGAVVHAEGLPANAAALLAAAGFPPDGEAISWFDIAIPHLQVRQVARVGLHDAGHGAPGAVYVGMRQQFLDDGVSTVRLDILVLLAVSVVLVGEALRFIVAAPAGWPVRTRGNLAVVRLLAVLFLFGEQLSQPFLPLFAQALLDGDAAAEFRAGMPAIAFLLTVALTMLLAPTVDRFGSRRVFLAGAAAGAAGLAGAAACFGIADFIAWRVVTAIGYALMLMACQVALTDGTDRSGRPGGRAVFVGALMASGLCAPGIGGILAERLGERVVFAVGAVLMVAAGLAAACLAVPPDRTRAALPASPWSSLRNLRLVLLLLTAAIPMQAALAGCMLFAVPMALAALGSTPAEIGRIAMLYAVPGLVAAGACAHLANRHRLNGLMVGAGLMVSGAGFLPVLLMPGKEAIAGGVLALGIGQAMSLLPERALATELCRDATARYNPDSVSAPYRLIARGGAALGPLAAAALTAWLGPVEALGVVGVAMVVCGTAFGASFLVLGTEPEDPVPITLHPVADTVP